MVDGRVLAMPVLDALREGVVDVPVIIGVYNRSSPTHTHIYTYITQRYLNFDYMHTYTGNMAQEVDAWPADEVEALSPPEWRAFLRRWFRQHGWGQHTAAQLAEGLERLYRNESDRDPQLAFDSLVSDYALTCGSLLLGTAAAASPQRTQPAYVYVNQWAPTLRGGAYDPRCV